MASRKRNWNINTPLRYEGKILRVLEGIIPDEEIRTEIAKNQRESWQSGVEFYRRLNQIIKEVLDSQDFYVSPPFRAPYYAFIKRYVKEVLFEGADPSIVYHYLLSKFREIKEDVVTEILNRLNVHYGVRLPKPTQRQ